MVERVKPKDRPSVLVPLPNGLDPYDMAEKQKLHPQADKMNMIAGTKRDPSKIFLACGAKSRNGDPCKSTAGMGTEHKGYGRCKYHGGNNTGPKTAAGKEAQRKASTLHGLYSQVLSPQEKEIFKSVTEDEKKITDLTFEIGLLKTKIISYLKRQREKWDKIAAEEGQEVADMKTRVWFSSGEDGKCTRSYYHAGTIEDKALDRTLNTLSRLIEKQIKLTGEDRDDLLDKVNQELRAASHGNISVSWGGPAQAIQDKPPIRKEGDPID